MRSPALLLAVALAALVLAPPAGAYVAPGATIVSASLERGEQADDQTGQVAISQDGRYVVFQTRARNFFADDDPDPPGAFRQGGVFRRDMVTGSLALVADGDVRYEDEPDTVLIRGAQNPSVSADGRFVAFSTGYALGLADTNGNVDVYVRDMARPATDPAAYDLVSARDGSGQPASYEPRPPELDRPGLNPGTEVTARLALSGDGRRVVFRTAQVRTDLPARGTTDTEGQQVFVRDRETQSTRLITRSATSGEAVGGAIGAATLSPDGTTVLWVGRDAPQQTRFIPGEGSNEAFEYYLWQRIADGPGAPTRRIAGITDPDDPGCPPPGSIDDNALLTGPCYGPLAQPDGFLGGIVGQVPALSGDGRLVAYVTNAAARAQPQTGNQGDLWLADMSTGVSRKAGSVELTREGAAQGTTSSSVDSVSLSAGGRWAAITSVRTTYVLPALRFVGLARPQATVRDLYLVDLGERTIERPLRGFDGTDSNGSVSPSVAISADGRRIAFTSSATNLFYGDANDRIDAFVVDRTDAPPPESPPPDLSGGQSDEAPLPSDAPTPATARLQVSARSMKAGKVRFIVVAPAPGTARVSIRGRLPNTAGRPSGRARLLASTRRAARRRGRLTVDATLSRQYRARLRRAGRITAQATIAFVTSRGERFERRLTVQFRR